MLPDKLLLNINGNLNCNASQNNDLYGSLPDFVGYGNLHVLQLSNNSFAGSFPANFGSGKFLTTVNLAYNL